MTKIAKENDRFVVYKPNGQRLDSRSTLKGAVQLAKRLFPSSKIQVLA